MTVPELAEAAQVGRSTIIRFEKGSDVLPAMRAAIRAAFERAGVRFGEDGGVIPPKECA